MAQEKSTSMAVELPPAPNEGRKAEKLQAPTTMPGSQPAFEMKPIVVKVFNDFSINVNGSFMHFSKDQVIADQNLAKYLLEQKCYVALLESGEYSVCPQCKHFYKK